MPKTSKMDPPNTTMLRALRSQGIKTPADLVEALCVRDTDGKPTTI